MAAVVAVVKAFGSVALLIALSILERRPAREWIRAFGPRISSAQQIVSVALDGVVGVLASASPVTRLTVTPEGVDSVLADGSVVTWIAGALISLDFTPLTFESVGADALVAAFLIQTLTAIRTWITVALVDVDLASGAGETSRTVASERAWSVDASSSMFAWRACSALVGVDGAVSSGETRPARADRMTVNGRSVTGGIRLARVAEAAVVKLAQNASLAGRTFAVEAADSVVASSAVFADCICAVVDVLATVGASPAVYANALIAAKLVETSRAILADIWSFRALVDVFATVSAGETLRTGAGVVVGAFKLLLASSAILAGMLNAAFANWLDLVYEVAST